MTTVMSLPAERRVTEVSEKTKRRRFTAEYKGGILREAEGCSQAGEVGALLRREGLYSSHLAHWRRQARQGQNAGLAPRKRGPKAKEVDPRDKRLAEMEREMAKLRRRAERAEGLVALQKKISQLLGIALRTVEEEV